MISWGNSVADMWRIGLVTFEEMAVLARSLYLESFDSDVGHGLSP